MTFTIHSDTPETTALWFQAILAVDKGWPSTLRREGAVWIVESDGKTVIFRRA
jgi:hypothetical protein